MTEVTKSSDEILTELFDSFKAEASVNVSDSPVTPKSPKEEPSRSKKKRKKDKKHKSDEKDKHRKKKKCKRHKKKESSNQSDKSNRTKKKKKRKYSSDSCDSESEAKQNTKIVTVESCNKENNLPEEKKSSEVAVSHISSVVNNFAIACDTSSIPLPPSTGDSILTPKVAQEVPEVKKPQVSEVFEKHAENVGKPVKKLFLQGLDKPKMSIKIGNLKNSQVLEAAEEAKIKADKYEEGEITDETSEESSKLLLKMETETSENGSINVKKQHLHSEEKICRKRVKSSDSSNINSSISSGDIKSDEHKNSKSEGGNVLQLSEETFCISENLEKVNKKSNENDKNATPDNKNLLKLKKLRQLRERNVDNSSSEDEHTNTKKSPPSKSTADDGKKVINKSKKRSNKQKSTTDSDRSSSSSDSSSSLERTRSSKSKEETIALKDANPSSKVTTNSISRRNSSPKTKYRKSRDRSVSEEKHSSSKAKKARSSSRSKLRKSRSRSKSIRNSRSQSRYFTKKSRSKSRSRQKKSLSRSRERKSRSYSYSRSRARKSRSRSKVRKSRTPKKYERKSRSVSKSKKSPTPSRVKSKKSRSPSRTKRRSSSPSESRGRRSTSRSMKIKSRSTGRKSSRSPSKLPSSKSVAPRSSSRSNIRSNSRNRSASKSRHSRSENRRSRSKNKRSSNRRSRSRDSHSKSKQSGVKNSKGNKERSNRSSSKHSYSKLSDSGSNQSESDSKYKGSKKKKSKDKKSNSRKHKSKHKDINSRLLALSSTKVESSSEDSSSSSESDDSDGDRKKSNKVKNLNNHKSDDKKSKSSKSKKDSKGKKTKDKVDSSKSKIVKEVEMAEDSDILKPKINLKQKIHYSLIDDEPIAMTESEMKILNAKNKLISKTINPVSISSTDIPTKNLIEKELKNKDFSSSKRIKCKQEEKNMELGVLKSTTGKSKLEDQLRKLKTDETKKVPAVYSPRNAKIDDSKNEYLPIGKSEDLLRNATDTEVSLSKSRNEDIAKTENLSERLDVEDNVKSPSDEISAKVRSEEKSKVKVFEKNKNSLVDDMKDLASIIDLPPTANSYDSDGQRSDTAMRNIFLGSQSSSNSPDHERPIKSYPHSNNDSNSSEESESESNDGKTFFGISKDCVENTYEVDSKTESLVKVGDHSSDSNRSFMDKNITDSDEDITYGKKQIIAAKQISDSTENTTSIIKENFSFEKSSFPIKDSLSVQNFSVESGKCGDSSNVGSIKVSVESIELTKEFSQSSILISEPSAKGLSINPKDIGDKNISSDLSPRKTNSQDFLYDYEKSEIEDEKLDFDEDKSSESDVTVPLKIEDMGIPNQKEKSNLTVNAEVHIDEININKVVRNIQEETKSSVVCKKSSASNDKVTTNEDVANLANEKIFSEEKAPETVYKENFPSDTKILVSNSGNTIISDTLDIPVPSEEKLDDIRMPIPSGDYKKEFNEIHKSENKLIMHGESKGFDKIDDIGVISDNVHKQFVKNESVILKTHDSSDNTTLSPLPVEDNKQKVTANRIKSVSRSRSRSKINKSSSKSKRSRRSKSKDRSTSRRPKSKEKSSNNRKGRSKSHDKRSRSKVRHSRSNERRRRSKERSLSGSGRSRSKDKSSKLKERSRERRSRSRRRALSRSKRRSRSRNRSSRSRRRNRSRSRDKKSRSRDRKNRSKSIEKRSRSRGRRPYSRSRERSRSRRHRARSQSSRDKRSRSYSRKERSRTKSKDRSESKDKKSKKSRSEDQHGDSEVKLSSRSLSLEKKSDVMSTSDDKKSKSSSKQEKSRSRSTSKDKEEDKNNGHNTVEEFKPTNKIILTLRSPIQSNSNIILASKKTFSRSKSKEDRSSSEKELESKTCEKSPDRSSKEKSHSPLSFSNTLVPEPKKYRSRSISVSKSIIGNKKSNSPDNKVKRSRTKSPGNKVKRSRTKSPDIKHKKSKTKSPDSKARRRSRSKSRDKQKNKEKRAKSKDRSESKEVKSKAKTMRKSRSRERKSKTDEKSSKSQRKRSRTRSKSKEKNKSRDKRSRSRERRSKSRDKKSRRSRSRSRRRKSDKKERSRRTRSRSKSRSRKRSKKSRSRSRSKDEFFIDKSKLLEIARKNALSMMKQGAVGTDLNKVTAITAGGKTVDELTDFCKLLSQKDATGQESVSSESSSENESEKPFHHPFQLKERSNNIIMNIRNCASLPVKTHLEKTTENAQQLRLQFPVSSGQLHRKSENEWIPVSPKKTDELKAIMPAPLRKQEEEVAVYPGLQETAHFSNIPLPNSIPHPQPPHLPTMPQIGNPWPKPHDSGLFTGTTGARFLSQAELASGQQAWAKKDQLICAQPVSGGMGMSLLQKMGWKPGEGLGKRNEGTLEPLKLQVKMDKRGLVCADEIPQPRFRPHYIPKNQPAKSLEGKHPVSLLVEYCTRKHLNPPMFTVLSEDGPAHKKNFVFKVTVNGVDYQPPNPSPNKKQAKSEAAILCLRALGLLPMT